ncbi:hypothetical protein EYF80_002501 [Liparis tanakae]|uniref:Uncharacterized protein n=1 Tax=Liparis tanakae TaxID=230148 RepID=A0A4Z2JAR1_9TELE|nr:hypothetical protein EYF80_002501 [Liparis tanakae]
MFPEFRSQAQFKAEDGARVRGREVEGGGPLVGLRENIFITPQTQPFDNLNEPLLDKQAAADSSPPGSHWEN